MRTSDFDYDLPPELIAQQPAEPRDSARLMVIRRAGASIEHHRFSDLPSLLTPGDLLVLNDTRVMAARLRGRRSDTGGAVEALLIRPFSDARWEALFRPARTATPGRRYSFSVTGAEVGASVVSRDGDTVVLDFDAAIDPRSAGEVPLPPYIKDYAGDPERYQTVYNREPTSAAAPTAGLHFTETLLEQLARAGIETATVTLDVGPGTFKPVTVADPREHHLHAEHVTVSSMAADAVERARVAGRRIVAVGTTVVRTLEHVARDRGRIEPYEGWTSLRILPGDTFRAVDVLVTNFHLPRSTLLMLVSAFAGHELTMEAYSTAVCERYRFYSFGDSMLILP